MVQIESMVGYKLSVAMVHDIDAVFYSLGGSVGYVTASVYY
jgi:hypothetical protein